MWFPFQETCTSTAAGEVGALSSRNNAYLFTRRAQSSIRVYRGTALRPSVITAAPSTGCWHLLIRLTALTLWVQHYMNLRSREFN